MPRFVQLLRRLGCLAFAGGVILFQAQRVAASCDVVLGATRSSGEACIIWCTDQHDPVAAGQTCQDSCHSSALKVETFNCDIAPSGGSYSCSTSVQCESGNGG